MMIAVTLRVTVEKRKFNLIIHLSEIVLISPIFQKTGDRLARKWQRTCAKPMTGSCKNEDGLPQKWRRIRAKMASDSRW